MKRRFDEVEAASPTEMLHVATLAQEVWLSQYFTVSREPVVFSSGVPASCDANTSF